MSTRSQIGKKTLDGRFVSNYCHSDGYPSYVGAFLLKYYNSEARADAILELGGLSSLDKFISVEELDASGETRRGRDWNYDKYKNKTLPPSEMKHSFDDPIKDVTVAYHRDRDEKKMDGYDCPDFETYLKEIKDSWCEYAYFWDCREQKWYVYGAYPANIVEVTDEEAEKVEAANGKDYKNTETGEFYTYTEADEKFKSLIPLTEEMTFESYCPDCGTGLNHANWKYVQTGATKRDGQCFCEACAAKRKQETT